MRKSSTKEKISVSYTHLDVYKRQGFYNYGKIEIGEETTSYVIYTLEMNNDETGNKDICEFMLQAKNLNETDLKMCIRDRNWINGNSWYTVNNAPSGYKKFNFIDGQSVKDITYKNNDLIIASAQWKINKYTLTVDPNGGTWGDGTSTQYFTQNYGTSRMLPVPIKTGYTFNGWHGTSSLRLFGRALYSDDQFLKGTNNMTVYNNAGNGTVTLNKITSSAALNTGSNKNIIQITSNGCLLYTSRCV